MLLTRVKRDILLNGQHIEKTANIIKEAVNSYPDLAMLWSTGKDSTVVLKEVLKIKKDIPVYFIDSHEFPETYAYLKWAKKRWNLNLKVIRQEAIMLGGDTLITFDEMTPDILYRRARIDFPEVNKNLLYWMVTKIIPLNEQVTNSGILTGMRWDEDFLREFLQYEEEFVGECIWGHKYKQKRIHPILHWTERDVHNYLDINRIAKNPLYYKGYRSIGDLMTTTRGDGTSERSGRSQDIRTIIYMSSIGYLQSINRR